MNLAQKELPRKNESLESGVARLILVWISSVFALLTVLTHLAQMTGMSFGTYSIIGVVVALIATFVVLRFEIPRITSVGIKADPRLTGMFAACCLFSAFLCLASYRPDRDDCHYLPNAVYHLENPDEPMGFAVHFMEFGEEPFVSYHRASIPFEYVQAIAARVANTHLLTVYYILAPALFGVMISLAWFYLLSRFTDSGSAAVFGVLIICLCLVLMGRTHWSYGNYAFNRIVQGKTVVFMVGIPLFVALTVDFFRSPGLRNWMYLLALSAALVGCSVASAVLIPMLALVLAVAGSLSYVSGGKLRLLHGIRYLCSQLYPVAYAISIFFLSRGQVGSESILNEGWPRTFHVHADRVIGDPLARGFLIAGTAISVLFLRGRNRLFLIVWFALTAGLYLNPKVAPLVIEHLTSPNLYWRVFYLLPFPLVIGLSGAALVSLLENRRTIWRVLIPTTVTALLLLAHLPESSPSVFRGDPSKPPRTTLLRMPNYKIAKLSVTRKILDASPPGGVMLAPWWISGTAAVLTAKHKHICYRRDGMLLWFEGEGRTIEAKRRTIASQFLGGEVTRESRRGGWNSVAWILERYPDITCVVARNTVVEAKRHRLEERLRQWGFTKKAEADYMVVFTRRESER
jgi:hypothetical protein